MGNHLRELIESVEQMKHGYLDYTTRMGARDAADAIINIAPRAMCFDFGPAMDAAAPVVLDLVRLPFAACWFEVEHEGMFAGTLAARLDDGTGFAMWNWIRRDSRWTCSGRIDFDRAGPDGKTLSVDRRFFHEWQEVVQRLHPLATEVLAGIGVLNCANIVTRRHDPDPKLQKARAKRGKQPLFSYHTLEIDPQASREAGIDQGGTHASPRVHLRRGHIRKFAPGKWCWVRETIVRGITPGMVHKDYALKGAVH